MRGGWWRVALGVVVAMVVVARPAVSASKGEVLFQAYCARCHGMRGAGDGPHAWLFATPPRDLRSGVIQKYSTSDLVRRVLDGRALPLVFDAQALSQRANDTAGLVMHIRRLPSIKWAQVEAAADLWVDRCETCHGPYGKPSPALAADPKAQDISSGRFAEGLDDDRLVRSLRHLDPGQPPLRPTISEADARAMLPYVRLFSPGMELYGRYCSGCHGEDGWPRTDVVEGGQGPRVVFDADYMDTHTDEQLTVKVWHMLNEQRPAMPHFRSAVRESDVQAIVEWLRSTTASPKAARKKSRR